MNEIDGEIWEMKNGKITAVKLDGVIFKKEADKTPEKLVMEKLKKINEVTTKFCPTCKQTKPITEFSKDKYKKDGLCWHCRKCHSKYIKKRYEKGKNTTKSTTKKCRRCDSVKPVSDFYKRKDSKDGLNSWCKSCVRNANKKIQHANVVKNTVVKYEKKDVPEIKISDGSIPLTQANVTDRKVNKWRLFKIGGN